MCPIFSAWHLKLDFVREILFRNSRVVWSQFVDIDGHGILGIQIELVEFKYPLQHIYVLVVHQVRIGAMLMPWVKGMESYHIQCRQWKGAIVSLADLVHVLVVSPAHHELIQTASRLVDAVVSVVARVFEIRIVLEGLREDNRVTEAASQREGITNCSPLRLAELREKEELPKVMDEASQVKPVPFLLIGVSFADGLSSLKAVVNLGKTNIRITLIHDVVQQLSCFPNPKLQTSAQSFILFPLSNSKIIGLFGVLLQVGT